MSLQFVDRYASTLASSYTSGGSSLSVSSATNLPSDGTCDFYLIVKAEGANTEEVFHVTSKSGTTLTVSGAQANTTASNHASGAVVIGSIMTSSAYSQYTADMGAVMLSRIVGSSSQASMDFTSLSQSYENLLIVASTRATGSVDNTALRIKVNNDSTSGDYTATSYMLLTPAGTPSTGTIAASSAGAAISAPPGSTGIANYTATCYIRINGYARTVFYKKIESHGDYTEATNATVFLWELTSWKSTAAISRLTFVMDDGNFVDGSVITIYGLH